MINFWLDGILRSSMYGFSLDYQFYRAKIKCDFLIIKLGFGASKIQLHLYLLALDHCRDLIAFLILKVIS
jgi:hypothetical protein